MVLTNQYIGYILYIIELGKGDDCVPVISRFHGIIVKMYLRQKEHNPPHVHAFCGDSVGVFSIETGDMYEGDLPTKEQQMVKRFVAYYKERIEQMWETQDFELLPGIE